MLPKIWKVSELCVLVNIICDASSLKRSHGLIGNLHKCDVEIIRVYQQSDQ